MECVVTSVCEMALLQRLVPQWEALAASALEPNPFYEHWLLRPALRAYAGPDVRVVCVSLEGRLIGLLPCQLVTRYKGIPVRALVPWRNPHALLATPLIHRERARECLDALRQWVERDRIASLIEFDFIPAGGAFHRALVDTLNRHDDVVRLGGAYTRGVMRRGASADAYLQSALSSDSRQKLRKNERRLAEQGQVAHRVLQAGGDVGGWIEQFLDVEASGWKGANGTALKCTEADRRFVEETFAAAFRLGRLVMIGIDLDGRPIARYCGFTAGEGSFAFKTAYDEAFRKCAPGLLAELDMVRAVHDLPAVRWMDSLAGHGNSTIDRMWKDRIVVHRLTAGIGPWGEFVVNVMLPSLQWAKRALRRLWHDLPNLDDQAEPDLQPRT